MGAIDVEEMTTGVLAATADGADVEMVTTVGAAAVLIGTVVGVPPFRHVQALDIFAGTLDQRAAYAGKV